MQRNRLIALFLAAGAFGGLPRGTSAQTCAANIPHVTGTWVTLPYQMPLNPISVTMLRTGQVLIVAGSENDATNNSKGAESYRAAVWDPTGTTLSSVAVQNLTYDVFCSGTATLPDGRPLVVGGTSDYSFKGENRASFFDPATGKFVQSQNMAVGRWYATATALGDGRIMAFSGRDDLTGGTTRKVELYDLRNAGNGWSTSTDFPTGPPLYPRMALLPNGNVFYTGHGSGSSNSNGYVFSPANGSWTTSAPTTRNRTYGSAVILPLLPPSYTPRVMAFGGGSPATNTTEIIDLSAASPSWTPGPNMSSGRIQMNAVILPNGKVLAEGGSVNNESPSSAGKTADLYDSVNNTMGPGGAASYSRLYHSVALLLPDATVASLGSNPGARGSYEPAIEIYTPPYLYDANDRLITTARPIITNAPTGAIGYGQSFSVDYTSNSAIASAVLVRPGSPTHAFDMEQRLIGLCGPSPQPDCNAPSGSGALSLTSPPSGNIAPPGYYMLFLLDNAGVPSKAQFVQISPYAALPPTGTITSPAGDVSILAGQAVGFDTNTSATKYSWVFPGGSPATSAAQSPGNVTFSTAGTYTASLTVIDATDNSDPSPPTRIVTVRPVSADFSIEVSPPAQEVHPSESTTLTVTVTPLSGFTGSVSLSVGSESGFPTGISSGGFSPSSISGGSGSSVLTMNTTTSTIPWALSLTITGTSGSLTHEASTTLLVNLAPPSGLSATPGSGQVSLSWAASVGASSYHVKRATVSGGPYVTVACPTGTSYVDPGLSNGTTYYYLVSGAFSGNPNAGGESADSSEVSATPQGLPPAVPTGLTASPGNAQVALAWNASSGATSYRVKRATVSGGSYTTIASPTSTSYTDTAVTNGTTYYYVVSAVSTAGESANSSQLSATPQATAPAPPTGLTASQTSKRRELKLRWTQSSTPGVTKNNLYRRTSGGSYPSAPRATINATTSYLDTGLTRGTSYCYRVTAIAGGLESAGSNEACAKAK